MMCLGGPERWEGEEEGEEGEEEEGEGEEGAIVLQSSV